MSTKANVLLPVPKKKRAADEDSAKHFHGLIQTPEQIISLEPKKFNRWTIVKFVRRELRPAGTSWSYLWLVKCSCGKEFVKTIGHIISGKSTSCGCLHSEQLSKRNASHGKSKSSTAYGPWKAMHKRCENVNDQAYARYGGRGIKVCKRWSGSAGFSNFLADMGKRPSLNHTIERQNVNKNYTPSNCSWATHKTQNRNKRNNLNITFDGRTQCLSAWAEEKNLAVGCLYYRIVTAKWPPDKALTTPSSAEQP